MKLHNNIRNLRFLHGEMSQQELADRIGVTRMTIYSIEKGNYIPSTLIALKMARVFRAPVEDLFFLDADTDEENGRKES